MTQTCPNLRFCILTIFWDLRSHLALFLVFSSAAWAEHDAGTVMGSTRSHPVDPRDTIRCFNVVAYHCIAFRAICFFDWQNCLAAPAVLKFLVGLPISRHLSCEVRALGIATFVDSILSM